MWNCVILVCNFFLDLFLVSLERKRIASERLVRSGVHSLCYRVRIFIPIGSVSVVAHGCARSDAIESKTINLLSLSLSAKYFLAILAIAVAVNAVSIDLGHYGPYVHGAPALLHAPIAKAIVAEPVVCLSEHFLSAFS